MFYFGLTGCPVWDVSWIFAFFPDGIRRYFEIFDDSLLFNYSCLFRFSFTYE